MSYVKLQYLNRSQLNRVLRLTLIYSVLGMGGIAGHTLLSAACYSLCDRMLLGLLWAVEWEWDGSKKNESDTRHGETSHPEKVNFLFLSYSKSPNIYLEPSLWLPAIFKSHNVSLNPCCSKVTSILNMTTMLNSTHTILIPIFMLLWIPNDNYILQNVLSLLLYTDAFMVLLMIKVCYGDLCCST